MKKTCGKVLLVLASILIFTSIVNGANNTSSIYNNSQDNNNSSIYNNSQDNNNSSQNRTSDSYKVLVDGYKGFYRIYRIYDVRTSEEITGTEYDNNTLNIHKGDTVSWSNEDPAETLTIISSPKLWENRTSYMGLAKTFIYKFNKTGIYDIYIRQHKDLPHQIINVTSLNGDDTEVESNSTNINKTIILKSKFEDSIDSITGQESPKSKVVIKTYRKPKQLYGFEIITSITIMSIVYICRKKLKKD